MDPAWYSTALSGLAVLLAALAWIAALRVHSDLRRSDVGGALDDLRQDLSVLRAALADEMRSGRDETGQQARHLREELSATLARLGEGLGATMGRLGGAQAEKVEAVATGVRSLAELNERRLADMRRDQEEGGKALREEVGTQVRAFGDLLGRTLDGSASVQKERLEEVAGTVRRLTQSNAEAHEGLRTAVEGRLETLRQENAAKLEEMRRTVDEKLQGTLEERLGEKFKLVSDQLANVFKSVGEMQILAQGVGDLKRVLTNVKTRGTWAEVSLGGVLEQVLAPEQFVRNVEIKAGSGERVEYAVRLPGEDERGVLLPIDAKFPSEDYERLIDASERGDPIGVETALKGLEIRIRQEGAKICEKYVLPPETTDFGILYLPTEGLYAEVIRRPGLVDHLQGQCRIVVAGPTVLLAILNSLRMGFRTLAIQKRSGEVFQTLSAVKTEFGKYGDVLDQVKKKLEQASGQLDGLATRRKAVDRKLRSVEAMPDRDASALLAIQPFDDEPAEDLLDAAE